MVSSFTMKVQEVKPGGRRLIGEVSVRRVDICTACPLDELSQETDEKRLMLLRAAAEHMS